MKMKTILGLACLVLGAALIAVLCVGCASAPKTPAATAAPVVQEAEPTPAAQEAEIVPAAPSEPVPSAALFAEEYFRVVGSFHPGTAGSSLRRAHAACGAYRFAAEHRIGSTDIPLLRSTMLEAWESLSEDERGWFDDNFMDVVTVIDNCLSDWESERPLFEDAGVDGEMAALLADPTAQENWSTLLAHTLTLGNSEG